MVLNPSNSSSLEHLALKGLMIIMVSDAPIVAASLLIIN